MYSLSAKDKILIAINFMKMYRESEELQHMSDKELDDLYVMYEQIYLIFKDAGALLRDLCQSNKDGN